MAQKIYTTFPVHRKVLTLLIVDENRKVYFGVVMPVEGKSHATEAAAWGSEGVRLPAAVTAVLYGGAIERLEADGYREYSAR